MSRTHHLHNNETSSSTRREWETNAGIVPLKQMEYRVYGDLIMIYPKPYSIYLRGTIGSKICRNHARNSLCNFFLATRKSRRSHFAAVGMEV